VKNNLNFRLMENLKFAVVGCGHIGMRHIKVISEEANAELVAVCDILPEVTKEIHQKIPGINCYRDYDELLEKEDVDVVCICTPHGFHAEMSIKAAEAKKYVLVEKPMALTSAESEKMIATAEENGVKLFVVKQNRYNTPIRLTTEALQKQKLGKIFLVQCNVLWNRHDEYYQQSDWRGKKASEGGALQTQVSHFLDLLIWWFGDITQAKSFYETLNHDIEIEDCGVSSLKFENGALGSLNWTTCVYNYNYEGSITIVGEKGTIKIGGKYLNEIDYWDVQSYPMPEDLEFEDKPNSYGTYQGSSSNHDKVFHELVENLMEGRKGVVEGDEGIKSIYAIEKIYGGQ